MFSTPYIRSSDTVLIDCMRSAWLVISFGGITIFISITSISPSVQTNMDLIVSIEVILDYGGIAWTLVSAPLCRFSSLSIIIEFQVIGVVPTFGIVSDSIRCKVFMEIFNSHVEGSIVAFLVIKFFCDLVWHLVVTIFSSVLNWSPWVSQLNESLSISKFDSFQNGVGVTIDDSIFIPVNILTWISSSNHHSFFLFSVIFYQVWPYLIVCNRLHESLRFSVPLHDPDVAGRTTVKRGNSIGKISTFDSCVITMEFSKCFLNDRSPHWTIFTNLREIGVEIAPLFISHWKIVINHDSDWDAKGIHVDSVHTSLWNLLI